ncbi:hypothetical protein MTO96_023220 [Rhipicephalus appendiculatus]
MPRRPLRAPLGCGWCEGQRVGKCHGSVMPPARKLRPTVKRSPRTDERDATSTDRPFRRAWTFFHSHTRNLGEILVVRDNFRTADFTVRQISRYSRHHRLSSVGSVVSGESLRGAPLATGHRLRWLHSFIFYRPSSGRRL